MWNLAESQVHFIPHTSNWRESVQSDVVTANMEQGGSIRPTGPQVRVIYLEKQKTCKLTTKKNTLFLAQHAGSPFPTRDGTRAPPTGQVWSLDCWTAREVPAVVCLFLMGHKSLPVQSDEEEGMISSGRGWGKAFSRGNLGQPRRARTCPVGNWGAWGRGLSYGRGCREGEDTAGRRGVSPHDT